MSPAGSLPPDAVNQIRSSNDAWHLRDLEAVLAPCAEEIEWDTTDAWPGGRVYRGLPAFRAYCEEVIERWGRDDDRLEIEEIPQVEASPSVVVHFRMTGRSR